MPVPAGGGGVNTGPTLTLAGIAVVVVVGALLLGQGGAAAGLVTLFLGVLLVAEFLNGWPTLGPLLSKAGA